MWYDRPVVRLGGIPARAPHAHAPSVGDRLPSGRARPIILITEKVQRIPCLFGLQYLSAGAISTLRPQAPLAPNRHRTCYSCNCEMPPCTGNTVRSQDTIHAQQQPHLRGQTGPRPTHKSHITVRNIRQAPYGGGGSSPSQHFWIQDPKWNTTNPSQCSPMYSPAKIQGSVTGNLLLFHVPRST